MGRSQGASNAAVAISLARAAGLLLLSSPGPAVAAHPWMSSRNDPSSPESSSKYKLYIILLKPRADSNLMVMDDNARRSWYLTFLPSEVTGSGEPRLVCSYRTIFDGFAAWLTEAELDAMSRMPGFGRWFPERKLYLQMMRTRPDQGRHHLEELKLRQRHDHSGVPWWTRQHEEELLPGQKDAQQEAHRFQG